MNCRAEADAHIGLDKEELDELFAQVLAALRGEGMITLERVMQDGTKVKAASPASFHREAKLRQHLEEARERVPKMGDPRQDEAERSARQRKAQERAAARSTWSWSGGWTAGGDLWQTWWRALQPLAPEV